MNTKLLLMLLFSILVNAQSTATRTLFEDSFESYDDFSITAIGEWITLDLDGLRTYTGNSGIDWNNKSAPQAFIVFNPSVAEVINETGDNSSRNFDPKTGKKYAGSWGAIPAEGVDANDDWLISPPITLGASSNEVSFWVKSVSHTAGLENYRVGVYVGSGTPTGSGDFTIITGENPLTAPFPDWEQKKINLDTYAGQTVRIGIHCVSNDKLFFMVDDFKVTTATLGTQDFFAENFTVYPNPVKEVLTIAAKKHTKINGIQITDLNGRIVKTVSQQTQTEMPINMSGLTAGAYFISVLTPEGTATFRFLKK